MKQEKDPSVTNEKSDAPWMAGVRFLLTTLIMLGILFLSAGTFQWWEAWAYIAMTIVVLLSSRLVLMLKNPELARERLEAQQQENVIPLDRILMPITAIYGPFTSWIIAGLDKRFSWSPDLPDYLQIIALGLIFLGSQIGTWAMIVNRFFSSQIRIQTDRGHVVVSDGPYRIVRHPGYAGGILAWLAAPFFFSSYWVIIPMIIVIFVSIIRTQLEDRTLIEELPGYQDYAQQVKYRLFPGIW
jgi:protein-S-isoprenylcysteine O-methyltransferase Ste14